MEHPAYTIEDLFDRAKVRESNCQISLSVSVSQHFARSHTSVRFPVYLVPVVETPAHHAQRVRVLRYFYLLQEHVRTPLIDEKRKPNLVVHAHGSRSVDP